MNPSTRYARSVKIVMLMGKQLKGEIGIEMVDLAELVAEQI